MNMRENSNMRECVLEAIKEVRKRDGFSPGLMRWQNLYFDKDILANTGPGDKFREAWSPAFTKRERQGKLHLSEIKVEDLDDESLLGFYTFVVVQANKQYG